MDGDTEYLVRVGDAVQDVDELKDLPLMDMGIDGIDTIRLSDVAEIKVTDNSDETYAVINGNPGIMLSMESRPDTPQEKLRIVSWINLKR